jgi:hypothetical protein
VDTGILSKVRQIDGKTEQKKARKNENARKRAINSNA